MSHEVITYGVIIGPTLRGENYRDLQTMNEDIIKNLQTNDEWPWFDKSAFALPGPPPRGTFRRQVIHFGLSMKDEPQNYQEDSSFYYQKMWLEFIGKFERILRQLYWSGARLHYETDFEQRKEYTWTPTDISTKEMLSKNRATIQNWVRDERFIIGEQL